MHEHDLSDPDWCEQEGIAPEPRPDTPVALTDTLGRVVSAPLVEPGHSSVVLTQGPHGTAWQRHADGLWYRASQYGCQGRHWSWMRAQRNLVLVYDAPER